MSSIAWFQDGVGYGAAQLADWQGQVHIRGGFKHVFKSTSEFLANSNQTNRTVAVGAGNVLIGGATSGATWAWSSGETVSISTASNDNPRKDLIVARLITSAVDGSNGLAIQVVQGTPAASPQVPTRPDNAVAIAVVDVPKATTTFTLTVVRTTGVFADQAAMANGHLAIDWSGVLPSPAAFPVGFTLYDFGTNQRWVRKSDGTWFTADPGPWKLCTPQNTQALDGTNITVTGTLYVRESSNAWELSGQLNFSPTKDVGKLVYPAVMPTGVSRPTQNTYGSTGQSYGSNNSGTGRLAIMTTGSIEFGPAESVANVYINESFSKSPWNA